MGAARARAPKATLRAQLPAALRALAGAVEKVAEARRVAATTAGRALRGRALRAQPVAVTPPPIVRGRWCHRAAYLNATRPARHRRQAAAVHLAGAANAGVVLNRNLRWAPAPSAKRVATAPLQSRARRLPLSAMQAGAPSVPRTVTARRARPRAGWLATVCKIFANASRAPPTATVQSTPHIAPRRSVASAPSARADAPPASRPANARSASASTALAPPLAPPPTPAPAHSKNAPPLSDASPAPAKPTTPAPSTAIAWKATAPFAAAPATPNAPAPAWKGTATTLSAFVTRSSSFRSA
jgi:hypothetical protein